MSELLLILDFGGQYKELIARAVRELGVYSEIRSGETSADEIKSLAPIGIIFTGGPNSVYLPESPLCDPMILTLGIPILGICYGMQMICHMLGGKVLQSEYGEYGVVDAELDIKSALFADTGIKNAVLMSHNDYVKELPRGFVNTGTTQDCINAACENKTRKLYGVQFHPETEQTVQGRKILNNFIYSICGAKGDYLVDDYIDAQVRFIREEVGKENILLALSGGVDSSVCAALLSKAVLEQLICIFVDHGFMRQNEGDEIENVFSKMPLKFIRVNAQERFLQKIKDIIDPELKRKLIGEEFIRVFEEKAAKLGNIRFLAQGTIYPDIIESGGKIGATIKSHHNVGGIPNTLTFDKIIEPLSSLFKDEVRLLGEKLGLPKIITKRQPFPGPGLAIRIMGDVTEEKLDILRVADKIACEEIEELKERPDQYFAVLTNVQTVGVKGDDRTYDTVIAVRAVLTRDFMTCEYAAIPHETLGRISMRITSEIKKVSRVVYDITSKPPGTIEWE